MPLVLLEQNVIPGKVNRLFGPLARWVACPDGETLTHFGRLRPFLRPVATGNPVRRSVEEARRWRHRRSPEARRRQAGAPGRRVLLIVGGSQGARALNRGMVELLTSCPELRERIFCIHITGRRDEATVREAYRRAGWMAKVSAYESHLPILLACSDLVVARAGGSSVSELEAIGVPSVLVPYPGHGDAHQTFNARGLARAGGCELIDEARFLAGARERVLDLLFDPGRLESMEERALERGRVDAADHVVDLIEELAEG